MPDLATHVLVNSISGKFLRAEKNMVYFILGSVLPDLLTRVPSQIIPISNIGYFVLPLHAPLPLLLVSYIIVLFFPLAIRKQVFSWLYGGILLHFLLDAFQIHMGPGYYWFYPFSWFTYQWGLFWPEDSLYLLPVLVLLFLWQLFHLFPNKAGQVKFPVN